jgi:hypothetical protein
MKRCKKEIRFKRFKRNVMCLLVNIVDLRVNFARTFVSFFILKLITPDIFFRLLVFAKLRYVLCWKDRHCKVTNMVSKFVDSSANLLILCLCRTLFFIGFSVLCEYYWELFFEQRSYVFDQSTTVLSNITQVFTAALQKFSSYFY